MDSTKTRFDKNQIPNAGARKRLGLLLAFGLLTLPLAMDAHAAKSKWGDRPEWMTEGDYSATTGRSGGGRSETKSKPRRSMKAPFAPRSHNFALDLGQVFLMGGARDTYPNSLGGQLHYTYGVSDIFGFDSSIGFSKHERLGRNFNLFSVRTGMRVNLNWFDRIVPYGVLGLGFYRPSFDVEGTEDRVSPIQFGIHIGPGVSLALTRNMFFGTAITFHDVFGTEEIASNGAIVKTGLTYVSFFINAGMSF